MSEDQVPEEPAESAEAVAPDEPAEAIAPDEPVGIRVDDVSKRFRGGVEAIRNFTLDVEPGEFMVLVGPSGCG